MSNPVEEYQQKIQDKLVDKSYLDAIEEVRREQRKRLDQIENEYYNQTNESIIASKPPLPKNSTNGTRPQFIKSMNIVRRHDDEIAFCPHRTVVNDQTRTIRDLSTDHIEKKLRSLAKEFHLNEKKLIRSTSASWAGRITIPEPFQLTESIDMENIHRRKCLTKIELEKLRKELEEELILLKQFKANPVPAHIHIPLYERLRDEEKRRREENFHLTKSYLSSISKPFGFDAREKAKIILRRHSFSAGDFVQTERRQFKAKPVPLFYHQKNEQNEKMKENQLYRSIQKKTRAKDLLEQSRLPFTSEKSQNLRRSLSTNDLANFNFQEYPFRPKTNGYFVPNFNQLHTKLSRQMEENKRRRSPTRCQPFLLYTNLIPSKKDQILHDIQNDVERRHSKSRQIKGKPIPSKSIPITSVSMNSERSESIPTKMTESQRLRESLGKKKRQEESLKNQSQENLQRSKSVRERRVREEIRQRTNFNEKQMIQKAERDTKTRSLRQKLRQEQEKYAKDLEAMNERVRQRPLLAEITAKQAAMEKLEKKFKKVLDIAQVSEAELIRQQRQN